MTDPTVSLAKVTDLAIFIGYSTTTQKLDEAAKAELDQAAARLAWTRPKDLLALLLTYHKSGLCPRVPSNRQGMVARGDPTGRSTGAASVMAARCGRPES